MFPNLTKRTALAALLAVAVPVAVVTAAPVPRLAPTEAPMEGADDLALTQSYCDLRSTVGAQLREDFAEVPTLAALTGTGMTMELWTSDTLGTWTVVHHGSDGISCVVTTGQDWAAGSDAVLLMDQALAETVHPA